MLRFSEDGKEPDNNNFDLNRCDGCGGALTKREQLSGLCGRCEKTVEVIAKKPRKERQDRR